MQDSCFPSVRPIAYIASDGVDNPANKQLSRRDRAQVHRVFDLEANESLFGFVLTVTHRLYGWAELQDTQGQRPIAWAM
jgi:hypothetical protein